MYGYGGTTLLADLHRVLREMLDYVLDNKPELGMLHENPRVCGAGRRHNHMTLRSQPMLHLLGSPLTGELVATYEGHQLYVMRRKRDGLHYRPIDIERLSARRKALLLLKLGRLELGPWFR